MGRTAGRAAKILGAFFGLVVILSGESRHAEAGLLSCDPPDCSPGCDESCTYRVCVVNKSHTERLTFLGDANLHQTPPDACLDVLDGVRINRLPFDYDGYELRQIIETPAHNYGTCAERTKSGPACNQEPPPPPVEAATPSD